MLFIIYWGRGDPAQQQLLLLDFQDKTKTFFINSQTKITAIEYSKKSEVCAFLHLHRDKSIYLIKYL